MENSDNFEINPKEANIYFQLRQTAILKALFEVQVQTLASMEKRDIDEACKNAQKNLDEILLEEFDLFKKAQSLS